MWGGGWVEGWGGQGWRFQGIDISEETMRWAIREGTIRDKSQDRRGLYKVYCGSGGDRGQRRGMDKVLSTVKIISEIVRNFGLMGII